MNTTVTRYDTAFYVQALDRFVATGECAETDTEPLYAYLLSVMNDSMVKVQVLGDEVCARIFYDTMIQFIQLNLEKERYNLRKSQSERTGMKLVLGMVHGKAERRLASLAPADFRQIPGVRLRLPFLPQPLRHRRRICGR